MDLSILFFRPKLLFFRPKLLLNLILYQIFVIQYQQALMGRKNGIYGYLAGTTTAAVLQPLDNIKMALILPPNKLSLSGNFAKNIYLAFQYIKAQEGWKAFYKGLIVNALKTGISSAVYFYLLRTLQKYTSDNSSINNFLSSASARIASAVVSNPLGVIQARYQIVGSQKWQGNIFKNLYRIYDVEGSKGFFKGCTATCWKEASFAGLYYTLYQKGKDFGLSSIVSGMASGIISTFITHPFEIIRTNIQVHFNFYQGQASQSSSTFGQLRALIRQKKAFDGVAPRLVKKPLANTLAFVLFEYMEKLQSKN